MHYKILIVNIASWPLDDSNIIFGLSKTNLLYKWFVIISWPWDWQHKKRLVKCQKYLFSDDSLHAQNAIFEIKTFRKWLFICIIVRQLWVFSSSYWSSFSTYACLNFVVSGQYYILSITTVFDICICIWKDDTENYCTFEKRIQCYLIVF